MLRKSLSLIFQNVQAYLNFSFYMFIHWWLLNVVFLNAEKLPQFNISVSVGISEFHLILEAQFCSVKRI